MKVKIIFDMDNPDDVERHRIMLLAENMRGAILEIRELLRDLDKRGHSFSDAEDAVIKIRENIAGVLNFYSLGDL